jgi:hypothetical protein
MRYSNFDITANSTPLYDSWGWADYWNCTDWINWHKALRKQYSLDTANKIWVDAWLSGVSVAAGGKGTAPGSNWAVDSVPLDCRTFNSEFRDYIKNNQTLYAAVYSGIGGTIAKPLGAGADVVEGVSSGIGNLSKVIKYGVPVLVILTTIYVAYVVYKKTK